MIVTLAIWSLGLAAITAVAWAVAWALVAALDLVGLGYRADREDGTVPFPAELLERGDHRRRRRSVAVGAGRPVAQAVRSRR